MYPSPVLRCAGLIACAITIAACAEAGPSQSDVETVFRAVKGPSDVYCIWGTQKGVKTVIVTVGERQEVMGEVYWPAKVHSTGNCNAVRGNAYSSLAAEAWERDEEYRVMQDGFGAWEIEYGS
ncbi:MAG: hypothetical protein ACYC2G_10035 [Gemmatimonadaceae bacterium]